MCCHPRPPYSTDRTFVFSIAFTPAFAIVWDTEVCAAFFADDFDHGGISKSFRGHDDTLHGGRRAATVRSPEHQGRSTGHHNHQHTRNNSNHPPLQRTVTSGRRHRHRHRGRWKDGRADGNSSFIFIVVNTRRVLIRHR